jgi:hypothetical protein
MPCWQHFAHSTPVFLLSADFRAKKINIKTRLSFKCEKHCFFAYSPCLERKKNGKMEKEPTKFARQLALIAVLKSDLLSVYDSGLKILNIEFRNSAFDPCKCR